MAIQLKRAYERPEIQDGLRFLVDRLWPRGKTKASLKLAGWPKEVAPSTELRRWFHHESGQWGEFEKRYLAELKAMDPELWKPLAAAARKGNITLIYGAKDPEHNHALVLKKFIHKKTAQSRKLRT